MYSYNVQAIHCPNCARKNSGVTDGTGGTRLICTRCGAKIYSKQVTPKKYVISVSMQ